jgi:hypothetical protein
MTKNDNIIYVKHDKFLGAKWCMLSLNMLVPNRISTHIFFGLGCYVGFARDRMLFPQRPSPIYIFTVLCARHRGLLYAAFSDISNFFQNVIIF